MTPPRVELRPVELRPVADDSALDEVVAAATSGADPDDVTPPLGRGWDDARLDWLRDYHRARFDGLAAAAAELTLAVRLAGRTCGVARLRALGGGRYETGVWLTRDVRGGGVGRAVLAEVVVLARSVGAGELVADTTPGNAAAQAVLRGAGFTLDAAAGAVTAILRFSRP